MEHYQRLERRTRETYRLGSWVGPKVIDVRPRADAEDLREGQPGLRRGRRAAHPDHGQPAAALGILDGAGTVRSVLRSFPAVAYVALWNIAGNPACSVPSGTGSDGLPIGCQLVGPTDGEEVLLSLAAQLEQARPWPLVAPTSPVVRLRVRSSGCSGGRPARRAQSSAPASPLRVSQADDPERWAATTGAVTFALIMWVWPGSVSSRAWGSAAATASWA